MAAWGRRAKKDGLPQADFALLAGRGTGMPLFAWPLEGSIPDVKALQPILQILGKLGVEPDCLMMDRGFASMDNISGMLREGHTFLQA